MTRRTERINVLLREELSDLLRREIRDPRVSELVTVTDVEVSPDLRYARVFVSVLGTSAERDETVRALSSASHFLRKELGKRLTIKRTPELDFRSDDSLERGAHLADLLRQVREERDAQGDSPVGGSPDDADAPQA